MIWKNKPGKDWLVNLDEHRRKEKPHGHPWPGPWYSDDGEDGVLNYLFEYIIDKHKFAVDLGAAHGMGGSQIRYLADKYDWGTTEFDYGMWNPMHKRIRREKILKDTICDRLKHWNTPKEFDLLSLDIDSMDYYILTAILVGGYRPNVAIIEYNPIFAHDEYYVRNYDENFRKDSTSGYGAGIGCFVKLMSEGDYTLIHNFANVVTDDNGVGIEDKSVQANNLLFLHNKFIEEDTIIPSISELHPKPWIESWKRKNIEFGSNIEEIKKYMIENRFTKLEL